MKKIRRSEAEWHKLLADCKTRSKGTSIAAWCSQQNITVNTYKYWQRKLQNQRAEEPTSFVSLPIPVQQSDSKTMSSEISIRYKGYDIVVTEQSSQTLLTSILEIVRSSC